MSKRSYRKRRKSSSSNSGEEEDKDELVSKVSEIKDVQRFRSKRGGINAISLAVGRVVSREEELAGIVFSSSSGSKKNEDSKQKYGLQVGNAFSAESNHREEDQLMNRYIEDELAKRRGRLYLHHSLLAFSSHTSFLIPKPHPPAPFSLQPRVSRSPRAALQCCSMECCHADGLKDRFAVVVLTFRTSR